MRSLRCQRCSRWTLTLHRVRTLDGRQKALCSSCLDARRAMGVQVDVIR